MTTALAGAEKRDAHAIGRGADAAALVATDFARRTERRTARHSDLLWRLTEHLDATAAERRTDPTAFVAAVLARITEAWSTRLARRLLRWAVLIRAGLTETDAATATLVAAKLSGSAHGLVARFAHAEVLGAWDGARNTDAAALRTTRRALDAKNCRAGVHVDRLANPGAVRPAAGGITTISWIVHALESVGARETGQPTAHAAGSRGLRR
jgi:hypothetical protein